jgi:hypothetical protein
MKSLMENPENAVDEDRDLLGLELGKYNFWVD